MCSSNCISSNPTSVLSSGPCRLINLSPWLQRGVWLLPGVISVLGMKSDVNSHPRLPPLFEYMFIAIVCIHSFIDWVTIGQKWPNSWMLDVMTAHLIAADNSLASFSLFDIFSLNCRCQPCRSAFIHSLLPSTKACLRKLRALLLGFYEHKITSMALNPSNMANLRNTTHTQSHTQNVVGVQHWGTCIQHCCVASAGFFFLHWIGFSY